MRIEKIKGHRIEIYDSIDELPISRFQKYNKYMLIDSGVGSDMQDIVSRITRAEKYIKNNPNLAVIELENMKQAIYLVSEEMSPKYMAFAVLVHKIDGRETNDMSEAGLQEVLQRISDIQKGWLDRVLDSVKKKIDTEVSLYFPGKFDTSANKEYYDGVREHTLLRLRHIINGDETKQEEEAIEMRLLMLSKPELFVGPKSAEIQYDKQFNEMCLVLQHNLQVDAQNMTVLQFYNAFDYLAKLTKKRK